MLGTGAVEVNGGHNLYEWEPADGQFQAVNILPGGAYESEKVLFGGAGGAMGQAISEDGSRVVWTAESAPSALYVREGIGTSQPVTVQADAPAGGGRFLTASSDDSKVFFADNHKLTADSTAGNGALGDLYRFEPNGPAGSRLVDLTVDHGDPEGAEVLGALGGSADGSYLYFVANGVLSSDPGVSRGNCTPGSSPAGATCNLYLWHEGWERRASSRGYPAETSLKKPALRHWEPHSTGPLQWMCAPLESRMTATACSSCPKQA